MTAKAGFIQLTAMVLVALASFGGASVHAQDTCLAAPNAPAPPGSHWYYRTDKPTQRKCWYVRSQDQLPNQATQATQAAPEQQSPAPPVNITAPAAAAAKPAQALPARRTQSSSAVGGVAQAARPSNVGAGPWTDPAPTAAATTYAWPDPPAPPVDDAQSTQDQSSSTDAGAPGATASTPAAANPVPAPDLPSTAAEVDKTGANDQAADKPTTSPDKLAARPKEAPIGIILAAIAGLLVAGAMLRQLLTKAFAHRQAIHVDRREPDMIESAPLIESARPQAAIPALVTPSPHLVPGHVETDPRFDEVEELLRKLAQRLRRPRSTPFKIIAPFSSSESAGSRPRP
jgi:hypothetical protein